MKITDLELITIQDGNGWTVYPKGLSGLVVQVEHLEDAPKELASMLEAALVFIIQKGKVEIVKLDT